MDIVFSANHNKQVAFTRLNHGDVFRMVNADDIFRFGRDCLFMKLDTDDFVPLTGARCGELVGTGLMSNCSFTIVEKVPNAAITLT